MIGAVTGRPVAVPVPPLLAWQQSVEGIHQVIVRSGAGLDDHDPGRRVRHEDRQETIALVRHGPDERLALGGQVEETAISPRPDADFSCLYGKMLRIASRSRPSPPPTGADSFRGSPAVSTDAPQPSSPTDVA